MAHTVLNLATKNLEEPHVAKEVQPSPMEKHCGQKGEVVNQGEMMTVASGIFSGNNPEIISELFKHAPRKSRLEQKNNPTQEYKNPCGRREASIWYSVSYGNHTVCLEWGLSFSHLFFVEYFTTEQVIRYDHHNTRRLL